VPKILNAKELPNVPLKTWGDIGAFTAIRIRKLIRSGKLGGSYHSEYADKKKAGKAAPSGVPQSSKQTSYVDLTLTGKMLGELKRGKVGKDFVEVGLSGYNAKKAEANANRGFDLFDTKVLNEIEKDVAVKVGNTIQSNINSYSRDTITFKVGK
jgi:hypothetical protein